MDFDKNKYLCLKGIDGETVIAAISFNSVQHFDIFNHVLRTELSEIGFFGLVESTSQVPYDVTITNASDYINRNSLKNQECKKKWVSEVVERATGHKSKRNSSSFLCCPDNGVDWFLIVLILSIIGFFGLFQLFVSGVL